MEYSIQKLARLAGVSARTLRYYDQIGLLRPCRTSAAGYRIYGQAQVDLLQQILFYRALDVPLADIARIVQAADFEGRDALRGHLAALWQRQAQTAALIKTVEATLASLEGGQTMSDNQKFEAFKQKIVRENEETYGAEVRKKYGDEAADASNAGLLGMTQADYARFETLKDEVQTALEQAVRAGDDPAGEAGRRIAALHKTWLGFTWKSYAENAHRGLAQTYVDDARFTAYYDRAVPGCAKFLRDAVLAWVPATADGDSP